VTVGEAQQAAVASAGDGSADHGKLGLVVRPLTPDERKQAGVEGGVMVEKATGPAARAGIQSGDLVVALDGNQVKSVQDLRGLVTQARGHVAVLVQRGEARIFVPVDLG
jgi:serine protease Do